jgi:hypothetical protein
MRSPAAVFQSATATSDHERLFKRLVFGLLLAMLAGVASVNVWRLANDPSAAFGSDWWWVRDGAQRLLQGAQLYAPDYLAGPYHQLDAGLQYSYNLAPSFAPLTVPLLALPVWAQLLLWVALMASALVAAFALVWPATARSVTLLAALILAVLPATLFAVWWANPSCLVALGVALVIVGDRRGDDRLITLGLICAGVAKVLPALPLVAWLLVRRRTWRPIAGAAAVGAGLLAIVVVLQGPSVLLDFVVATRNAQQETGVVGNVAPSLLLAPHIGASLAQILPVGFAVVATLVALTSRVDDRAALVLLLLATYCFVPNLWVHWLLAPLIATVAFYGHTIASGLALLPPGARLTKSGPVSELGGPVVALEPGLVGQGVKGQQISL